MLPSRCLFRAVPLFAVMEEPACALLVANSDLLPSPRTTRRRTRQDASGRVRIRVDGTRARRRRSWWRRSRWSRSVRRSAPRRSGPGWLRSRSSEWTEIQAALLDAALGAVRESWVTTTCSEWCHKERVADRLHCPVDEIDCRERGQAARDRVENGCPFLLMRIVRPEQCRRPPRPLSAAPPAAWSAGA
jgi:hypothetical protein